MNRGKQYHELIMAFWDPERQKKWILGGCEVNYEVNCDSAVYTINPLCTTSDWWVINRYDYHVKSNFPLGCPIKKPQLLSNTTSEGSGISLGEVSYEAYLYICLSMGAGQPSQWTPVCGGEHWTNREAKVACHQLGYPNTTTIGTQLSNALVL